MRKSKVADEDRLHHILEAINFILNQTAALAEDEFYKNEVLKKAVVHDLNIIGEAANYISAEIKQKYPGVSWPQIVATRHRLIHEYFYVNYRVVWEIIQNDLPVLKEQIEKVRREFT